MLPPAPLSHVHSGLSTVKWQAALCPRDPSCLCYLLALCFSYTVISSSANSPAHFLYTVYILYNHYIKRTTTNLCSFSLSLITSHLVKSHVRCHAQKTFVSQRLCIYIYIYIYVHIAFIASQRLVARMSQAFPVLMVLSERR